MFRNTVDEDFLPGYLFDTVQHHIPVTFFYHTPLAGTAGGCSVFFFFLTFIGCTGGKLVTLVTVSPKLGNKREPDKRCVVKEIQPNSVLKLKIFLSKLHVTTAQLSGEVSSDSLVFSSKGT